MTIDRCKLINSSPTSSVGLRTFAAKSEFSCACQLGPTVTLTESIETCLDLERVFLCPRRTMQRKHYILSGACPFVRPSVRSSVTKLVNRFLI